MRNRTKGWSISLVILLLVSLVLSACATPAPQAQQTPLKIGWVGALSGDNAIMGKWNTDGIKLLLDDVNSKGGVAGRKIELVQVDDQADASKSVTAVKNLILQENVLAVIGSTNSTPTISDIDVTSQYKVAQMTQGVAAKICTLGSGNVFRVYPNDALFSQVIVDYLVKDLKKTKFALIRDTTAFGQGQFDGFNKYLAANNLKLVADEQYNPEDKDFTGQLLKIQKSGAEVLLLGASEIWAGLIAKQARQLGMNDLLLAGGTAVGTPKYIESGGAATDGTYFAAPYINADFSDATKKFAADFQKKYNYEPDAHVAGGYVNAQALVYALQKAGPNPTRESILAALKTYKVDGSLFGPIDFTKGCEGFQKMMIGKVAGGKLTQVRGY